MELKLNIELIPALFYPGVPVIPVVITLSIDPDLYIGGPK